MSDISISITSDPQQAINGIIEVRKEADKLVETQRKVQAASDAAATDATNSVSSVSREVAQGISEVGSGLGSISSGIKSAGTEASKMSNAFGKSIPVIGQLGSAISAALTGPVAAVSAAIGIAIAGINKMIAEMEARVQRLKASAGTQASTAYDTLLQGRAQYAQDLQTLEQVRKIQSIARQSGLDDAQLKQFKRLAAQVGIDARDVGARGIRGDAIDAAAKKLTESRRFYAEQEFQEYQGAVLNQLFQEITSSNLDTSVKNELLAKKNLGDIAASITSRARRGAGWSLDEYQAYQDLYGIVKQYNEVQESYKRDKMLGRSQADLNAAAVASITAAQSASAAGSASGSGGSGAAEPGTLAWAKEQTKKELAALQKEQDEQQRRTDAAERLTEGLERQIRIQQLITDGKEKEAFILRNRLSMEDAYGRTLTEAEAADNARLAATLYDLQHPVIPQAEPGAEDANFATRAHTRAASASAAAHLDRLQQIGANVAASVISPEKRTLDRSLSVQEDIRNMLRVIESKSSDVTMRF